MRQRTILFHEFAPEELRQIISETIREELKTLIEKQSEQTSLLSRKQAAEFLNVSVGTIDNMKKDGRLRYQLIRGSIRFDKRDLIAFGVKGGGSDV